MDLLDGELMDFCFGFGEAGENFGGPGCGAGGKFGVFDSLQNDGEATVMMAFAGFDFHVGGEDFAALYFCGGNFPAFETEFAQFGFDGAPICTGVHQGAQNHVAADAGKTVEICVPYAFHSMSCANPVETGKNDTSLAFQCCQICWRNGRVLICVRAHRELAETARWERIALWYERRSKLRLVKSGGEPPHSQVTSARGDWAEKSAIPLRNRASYAMHLRGETERCQRGRL